MPDLIRRSRYEVIPLAGVEEQVLEFVPKDVEFTVTVSPAKGLEPSFELAETLIREGYAVVPHLSARLVRDRTHLAEIVARFADLGMRDVFVVAGDADDAGAYEGAAALLRDLHEIGHPFERIGITGYPETHPLIDDATVRAAMAEKAPYANYIATQICFDPAVTMRWIDEVWAGGIHLPVYVGLPGAVQRAGLLRVSTRIGIGESVRYLRKHHDFVTRFFRPGGFSPDKLIQGLAPAIAGPDQKIAGFHIFTFNDLADTEAWRQRKLAGR
ncbi:MAG: 5,10-methylenetetrahydrofolate reductase [Thermoleophilia bacterium]|nr:5,10-methylenetetrahydrofolate reductase [Thermoleophilia bacterium]